MIPIVPFNLSNFMAGLTGIRFTPYLLGTAIGILPSLTVLTYFADVVWNQSGTEETYGPILTATLLLLLTAIAPWLYQRRHRRNVVSPHPRR